MSTGFDAVIIGAGPAGLACALRLKQAARSSGKDISVAVIEKSQDIGDHILSGAVMGGEFLMELLPDFMRTAVSLKSEVQAEYLYFLTKRHAIRSPVLPPMLANKGSYVVSLSEIVRKMAEEAEKAGVEIYTGETVEDFIEESGRVTGVIIKEKNRDRFGKKKGSYISPVSITAKVIVAAEGSRGYITKKLIERFSLTHESIAQGYAVGVKELWRSESKKHKAGTVINTIGYPLPMSAFGGGYVYHMKGALTAVGLVIGLDYRDPGLDPFEYLQSFKMHPLIKEHIRGRLISYGAKTICEGGWYAMPRPYGNGFVIVGESAGVLDSMRLKGIDPAVQSGMIAADVIHTCLDKGSFSADDLSEYYVRLRSSKTGRAMWKARNFHQAFHKGMLRGMMHVAAQMISGGRGFADRMRVTEDRYTLKKCVSGNAEIAAKHDGIITFDRPTCVFASGTKHDEDQPCHIAIKDEHICTGKCAEEYGNPCLKFCPAGVFEMETDSQGRRRIKLNPSNCLHCRTCDIKDPYNNVEWHPPEAGGGPNYREM